MVCWGREGGEMAQQLGTLATFAEDLRVQFRTCMSENSQWPVAPALGHPTVFRNPRTAASYMHPQILELNSFKEMSESGMVLWVFNPNIPEVEKGASL